MRATLRLAVMALFLIGFDPNSPTRNTSRRHPRPRRLNVAIPIRPTRWYAREVHSSARYQVDWLK